jgi:hypothetical protein
MRMQAIETEKLGPLTIEIHYDTDASNPRETDYNFATIAYLKNRRGDCFGDVALDREELDAIEADTNNICLPLYAMVHSGVALSTREMGCPWDSGRVGVVYVKKEKAQKEFGEHYPDALEAMSKIQGCMRGEVETFSQFLNGEVYGYVVKNSDGETLDSCWGFIGGADKLSPIEYVMSEAKDAAKHFLGERYRQAAEKALAVQDACNLSGVVYAFAEAMKGICEESNEKSLGTAWKNEHAIVSMFLAKLNDLNRYQDSKICEYEFEVKQIAVKK